MNPRPVATSGRRSGQRFDAQHGVVTEALLFLGELDPIAVGSALADATHYEATPLEHVDAVLDAVPHCAQWTFVDLGAGMGRVVMLASLRNYKQVVGIEVSPALCEVARDNCGRWRRAHPQLPCKDIRVVCADARTYRFPRSDLVAYLYNPFGESSVQAVVHRLARHPHRTYAIYHTPVHRRLFDEDAAFECVAEFDYAVVYRRTHAS
jgi:SAM-dependent methyltransferase